MKKELYFTGFDCLNDCYFILKTSSYNINNWGYYDTIKGTCSPNNVYESERKALGSLKKGLKPIIKLY